MRRLPVIPEQRPRTREQCLSIPRPCPFVGCRHHLLLEVAADGRIFKNFDFDEDDEWSVAVALVDMPETCSRDVAERGSLDQRAIAVVLNTTQQNVSLAERSGYLRAHARGLPPRSPLCEDGD